MRDYGSGTSAMQYLNVKQVAAKLPPMTEGDMQIFVQFLTGAVMWGATRIEFHPERWRLLLDNMLHHRAYPADKLHWMSPKKGDDSDYGRIAIPLAFTIEGGMLTCMLMQRQEHTDEGEHEEVISGQGPVYPVPEADPEVSLDERADKMGIVLPFKPKLH